MSEPTDPYTPAFCVDCGTLCALAGLYPDGRCQQCHEFYQEEQ